MSGFFRGFLTGYALSNFGCLSLYGRRYGLAACNQMALNTPYIFSAYADLDSPSGLSSPLPAVNYGLNGGYYGGYSGFSNPFFGCLGLGYSYGGFGGYGLLGGFGYYC